MSSSSVVTARLDQGTLDRIDRLAKAQGRSRSWFVAEAVRGAVEREEAIEAAVQRGLADLDQGRVVPHEVVVAEIEDLIARAEQHCSS